MPLQASCEGGQEGQAGRPGCPPLEAKTILFALWSSVPGMCLDFGDAVRAYCHARSVKGILRRGQARLAKQIYARYPRCSAKLGLRAHGDDDGGGFQTGFV